jgi:hypothetical protein
VIPQWHPAPSRDFDEVKKAFSKLNENLLFDSYEDACSFREYYKTKSWGEKVPGDFSVIRVTEVR